jgi:hypothetical protein
VLQLLPVRVLLPSSETDASTVLGEGNDGWKLLSRRGEGILNSAGGAVEANVPFQAAIQSEDERLRRLRALRSLADSSGFTRRPVVFEGYAAARMDPDDLNAARDAERVASGAQPLLVGTPMRLSGPVVAPLRRESAANALIVAKPTSNVPLSLLMSSTMSIACAHPSTRIAVVDFTAIDDGVEDALAPLVASGAVTVTRRRTADRTLASLADEVAQRVARDEVRAEGVVLVLYGLHRARDLDANSGAIFDEPDGPDLLGPLKQILVDGPEVGVHTIAWVDSVAGLKRRLPSSLTREFGLRIAGTMSRDDSVDVIDTDLAATCKHHQVVVVDDSTGNVQRATTYGVPDVELVGQVAAARGRG